MFFPEPLSRIRILVHESLKLKVIKQLHELGAVQISDYREKLSQAEWGELLDTHPPSPDVRRITTQLMAINRMLDIFSMIDPEDEEGFFKQLFSPSPPQKNLVDDLCGEKLFTEAASRLAEVEAEVSGPMARLENIEAEAANLKPLRDSIKRILSLDVPLEALGEGPFVNVILGIAPNRDFLPLQSELAKSTNGTFFFSTKEISERESCLLVICLVSDAERVAGCLRKWDLERITREHFKGIPKEVIAEIDGKMKTLTDERAELYQGLAQTSENWRRSLQSIRELLLIERERAEVHSWLAKTEWVTAIEGWVATKKAAMVVHEIERCSSGMAAVQVSEPDEPAGKLPVALDNPGLLKHFELLTKLYAPPKYDEVDPTVLIFPSFLFYFGLMITDAMYGLMTLIFGVMILRGGGRFQPLFKSAGMLLTLGGAVTLLLGAMTGGWFGNLAIQYLGMGFLNNLIILNPMVDVSQFLLFSLGVGLFHLNLGIVVGIIKDLRRRDIPSALKHVWIFFFELALGFYYLHLETPALFFMIPAALLLLYSAKGMFLFGITGLLGDTLSYARLMALGLVSFGLAVAINALAKMVWGIHYVGWFFAILILTGGHLFSWVLNLMGAFAHGIRLHFVEFFGKFYEGGGEEFTPFRIKREITESR